MGVYSSANLDVDQELVQINLLRQVTVVSQTRHWTNVGQNAICVLHTYFYSIREYFSPDWD